MAAQLVDDKESVAIGIALQTQVLRVCPIHNQLYCEQEQYSDDENMAPAHSPLAIELVHPASSRIRAKIFITMRTNVDRPI